MYTTGEPAMVGAVAAARSQNKADTVKLFGWDLTAEVITGIDDGFVLGVVQQDPKTEGYEAVKACKALVDGETVPSFIDVPIVIVTKDNVDPYREIFK
jgi:ribose transport system substrate-binding protein